MKKEDFKESLFDIAHGFMIFFVGIILVFIAVQLFILLGKQVPEKNKPMLDCQKEYSYEICARTILRHENEESKN